MKYRKLTEEELEIFREDFISFLVVNGIAVDDWKGMLDSEPEKCERLLDIFSDHVFETVLRKVDFLSLIADGNIKTFQCLENKIVHVAYDTDDACTSTDPKEVLNTKGNVYFAEKPYVKTREEELFDLICSGCSISDGVLFKKLSLLLV